jgi:ParB-like chromosome segregation protein Spo0J
MNLIAADILARCRDLFDELESLPEEERIDAVNAIRLVLREHSPLRAEPVDCVLWVRAETVEANAYNPNTVAAPEMRLLQRSIEADGYTQPIVAFAETDGRNEVVDGFHRNRVGKECPKVRKRVKGRLPVVLINRDRAGKADRIAATIRHNRARGKHGVEAMSEIVMELARRNWPDEKIGKELGMDADEVLRLKQITGLAEMFADAEFSEAWEA